MTNTPTTAPAAAGMTDAELMHVWDTHVGMPTVSYPFGPGDILTFGRAAIAADRARAAPADAPSEGLSCPWCHSRTGRKQPGGHRCSNCVESTGSAPVVAVRCPMEPITGCSNQAKCHADPCGLAVTPSEARRAESAPTAEAIRHQAWISCEKLDNAAELMLSKLAGIDTYDVNLRDHSEAWAAVDRFTDAVMEHAKTVAAAAALVRAESASAAPVVAVPKGWVAWSGGDCPVEDHDTVKYRLRRDGPGEWHINSAGGLFWHHDGKGDDIVSYTLAATPAPIPAAPSECAACEGHPQSPNIPCAVCGTAPTAVSPTHYWQCCGARDAKHEDKPRKRPDCFDPEKAQWVRAPAAVSEPDPRDARIGELERDRDHWRSKAAKEANDGDEARDALAERDALLREMRAWITGGRFAARIDTILSPADVPATDAGVR